MFYHIRSYYKPNKGKSLHQIQCGSFFNVKTNILNFYLKSATSFVFKKHRVFDWISVQMMDIDACVDLNLFRIVYVLPSISARPLTGQQNITCVFLPTRADATCRNADHGNRNDVADDYYLSPQYWCLSFVRMSSQRFDPNGLWVKCWSVGSLFEHKGQLIAQAEQSHTTAVFACWYKNQINRFSLKIIPIKLQLFDKLRFVTSRFKLIASDQQSICLYTALVMIWGFGFRFRL